MSYCKFHPLLVKKLLLSGHQWQVEIIDLKMTLTSRTLALNLRDDFLKGVRIVLLFKKHILIIINKPYRYAECIYGGNE